MENQQSTTTSIDKSEETSQTVELLKQEGLSIEDFTLPKAVLSRLAKAAIPKQYQIQAEAKLAIGNAAVVFISYITAVYYSFHLNTDIRAHELALKQNHKNISAQDLIDALDEVEMSEFKPHTKDALAALKDYQSQKRALKRTPSTAQSQEDDVEDEEDMEEEYEEDMEGDMMEGEEADEDGKVSQKRPLEAENVDDEQKRMKSIV